MAKCDEGYLCEVCGSPVETLAESSLYLQFVIGWIDPETLHTRSECHLRCNPNLAQYVESEEFEAVSVEGDFDKRTLDPNFVQNRAALVTRGFLHLQQLQRKRPGMTVTDYLLPEFQDKWK